jgi:hypothetical protein
MMLPRGLDGTSGSFTTVDQLKGSCGKSVGEVMPIGRTFDKTLQKALRRVDVSCNGCEAERFDLKQEITRSSSLACARGVFPWWLGHLRNKDLQRYWSQSEYKISYCLNVGLCASFGPQGNCWGEFGCICADGTADVPVCTYASNCLMVVCVSTQCHSRHRRTPLSSVLACAQKSWGGCSFLHPCQ